MDSESREAQLIETIQSMAELLKKVESFASNKSTNEFIVPSLPDMLWNLHVQEFGSGSYGTISFDEKYELLIQDLEKVVAGLGFPYLEITMLTDVMLAGNDILNRHPDGPTNMYEMLKANFEEKVLKYAGNPDQAIANIINEIKSSYKDMIVDKSSAVTNEIKPIFQWERQAIGFYCNQQRPDISLRHVLYFLVVENHGDPKIVDADNIECAFAELSYGTAMSMLLPYIENRKRSYVVSETAQINHSAGKTGEVNVKQVKSLVANFLYFEINATYNKLKVFRKELEHLGYIDKTLSADSFRRIFLFKDDPLKDKLKQQAGKPIDWLINKSHLGYLIKLLSQNNIITDKEYYKIAENCFLFDGEPIANTVFHKMQLPAIPARRKIDKIVDALK